MGRDACLPTTRFGKEVGNIAEEEMWSRREQEARASLAEMWRKEEWWLECLLLCSFFLF